MTTKLTTLAVLLAALSGPALAQTATPTAAAKDPFVQLREDQRAANAVYALALINADADKRFKAAGK